MIDSLNEVAMAEPEKQLKYKTIERTSERKAKFAEKSNALFKVPQKGR